MNKLNLSPHIVIPISISLLLLVCFHQKRKNLFNGKGKLFWLSVLAFMSSYLLLMIYVCYVDNQLQWNLNRFDLNQDVSFSSEEKTSDQKAALKKVTADNVRNFASITGMILPALFAISTFMLGWLI